MGLNMVNIATDNACQLIAENTSTVRYFLRSNLSADKKPSFFPFVQGYGKEVTVENLLLQEQNGWTLSSLDHMGQTLPVLQKTFTSNDLPNLSKMDEWTFDLTDGNTYELFSYAYAEIVPVPEPSTLFVLGFGIVLMRRAGER